MYKGIKINILFGSIRVLATVFDCTLLLGLFYHHQSNPDFE